MHKICTFNKQTLENKKDNLRKNTSKEVDQKSTYYFLNTNTFSTCNFKVQ